MEFSHQPWSPFLILGLVLCFGFNPNPEVRAERVDQIAATVDEAVITASQLTWFIQYRGIPLPADPSGRESLYRSILDQLINQELIIREAVKTPFIAVRDAEIEEFKELYRRRFPSLEEYRADLARKGLHEDLVTHLIRRQIAVNKFVELRFEPFVIVLPSDVTRYYENDYRLELQGLEQDVPPLDLVEETIRQILNVRKTEQQLERWIQNTRQKVQVQVLMFRENPDSTNLPGDLPEQDSDESLTRLKRSLSSNP